jgi:hypothetical protein
VAAHPEDRWSWRQEVVVQGTRAHVICAHCRRTKPCPTEEYLHGQSGHDLAFCCDPFGCYVFENARYAREHEVV